jgi:hypothetical protein
LKKNVQNVYRLKKYVILVKIIDLKTDYNIIARNVEKLVIKDITTLVWNKIEQEK